MLNIISRAIVSRRMHGPRKVVDNLIRGLDLIGVPYVVNHALDATSAVWVHDDPVALQRISKTGSQTGIIVGPNIYSSLRDLTYTIPKEVVWLSPATWVRRFWQSSGFNHERHAVWPVGIDTDRFAPLPGVQRDTVVVYIKQRSEREVQQVINLLEKKHIRYVLFRYGNYKETEYKRALEHARGIIWIGRSESQGIALLEALSMDVPALVWDVPSFGVWHGGGHNQFTENELSFTEATAAPYFSSACGLTMLQDTELEDTYEAFMRDINRFAPRTYVSEHLSLAGQARAFVQLYKDYFNLSEVDLKDDSIQSQKMWRNAKISFKILTRMKDAVRTLIR